MSIAGIVLYLVLGIFGIVTLFLTLFTVEQQKKAVIQRFGKFVRIAGPGLNIKIPYIETVAAKMNLRIQQLNVEVETKTEDNVTVKIVVAVQYFVMTEKVYDAYYRLQDPEAQITSYVFNVVRAQVPKMKLDKVFDEKDDIASAIQDELLDTLKDFGYGIIKALVTDIDMDSKVKAAEAEAESKALQGKGIADQRRAIVAGLQESVSDFQTVVSGATAQDVMSLVMMTQYFDTLESIGASSRTNTLVIPHSPGALGDLVSQFRNSLMSSQMLGSETKAGEGSVESKES